MALPHAFRALRYPAFRRYWAGWAISVLGSWMQTVAQGWLVYRLTNSAQALGLLTALRFGPTLVALPFAGVLTDYVSRRRLLALTQSVSILQATLLAWLTLSGNVLLAHVLLLALVQGFVDTLDMPARQSFQVELVPVADLQSAISLNSAVFNGGRLVGPAIAGVLVARYGEGWCFLINALSFFPFLFAVLSVRGQTSVSRAPFALWPQLIEGVRFAWNDRRIRSLLVAVFLTATFGLAYSTLLPALAKTRLGADARGYGLLLAASGLGAMVGSLWVAARRDERGSGRRVFLALCLLGLSLMSLAWTRFLWAACLSLVVAGWAVASQLATTNGTVQTRSPAELRARLISLYIWVFSGGTPLGGLWAGFLAQKLGTATALLFGGAVCLAGAAWFAFLYRSKLQ